jgi:hypothetical protein
VPEAFEFPDISSRYDAPGSIAGHRRGVRVRAVCSVPGDAVHGAGKQRGHAEMRLAARSAGPAKVQTEPRQWSPAPIFRPTNNALWNLDIAPDCLRFVVLAPPESGSEEPTTVHATILLNFFDELRRLQSN